MNAVVTLRPSEAYTGHQLDLIRRTVAAGTTDSEFDLFITVARRTGLDPFRKQIYAVIHNAKNSEKRKMTLITGIDGMRAIAARSGRYRPDEEEPAYTYDPETKDAARNPLGLVKASVRIWIADAAREGGWRPVAGVAYWDEFAPISEEWAEGEDGRRRPSGRMVLDTKGQWGKMPRVMLAKTAEAQALRKAFPEDLSGLYENAEMDQAGAAELLPSEAVGAFQADDRLKRIGVAGGIMFQLFPNAPLEAIPVGQVFDRVEETVRSYASFEQIRWFSSANTQPLREFWARAPGDALALKKVIEEVTARLQSASAA